MNTIDLVRSYLAADVPCLLWGAPGTGKTAAIHALARGELAHVEVLIGSTLDPLDVGGYLLPSKHEVRSAPPPWAVRLRKALDAKKTVWLVLDELSCAPPSVQAALLRVVNERRVGELDLRGCRVVAAANPAETAADGGDLSAAAANRWAHLEWTPDVTAWAGGTLANWGQGHATPRHAEIAASVASHLQRLPGDLLAVPEDLARAGRAWPSPRSWSAAIAAVSAAPDTLSLRLAEGCVGPAAQAWHTSHISRDLPNPEAVLSGAVELPTRGDKAATTLAAVVAAALCEHPDQITRVDRAWGVLVSARADVAVSAARALLAGHARIPPAAVEYAERLHGGGVR